MVVSNASVKDVEDKPVAKGKVGYAVLPPIVEEMTHAANENKKSQDDNSGYFVCWGCGEFGQHCHGNKQEVTFQDGVVEKFCGPHSGRVKHVACGSSHTVVVTNANEIYVWGNGNSGQLGCKDLNTHTEPTKIELYKYQAAPPKIAGVACGGRHSMVWLENGHVFSFGNNFHAQLGYDFKEKNYKQNQDNFWDDDGETTDHYVTQPTLLKLLTNRPVAQIACGDKHTIFRFKDGALASVGNNASGQLGTDSREDSVVPKLIGSFQHPIKTVACGTHHTLAVTDSGEVYAWGYGKACGNASDDVLVPTRQHTFKNNIVAVAGGNSHSMALSANGSVYTWGNGIDGQLGHGDQRRFLDHPKRVKDRHIAGKVIQISCGETYSAAVTEKGLLYLWGKNSHTIYPGQPTTHKTFLPHGVNKNFRGGRVKRICCGFWHAAAILGRPTLLLRDEHDSDVSDEEEVENMQGITVKDILNPVTPVPPVTHVPQVTDNQPDRELESSLSIIPVREKSTLLSREKTQMSIADFYAPTPIPRETLSPSPDFFYPNTDEISERAQTVPPSARSLVVQVPVQPVASYVDAATSPMTLSTTTGSKTSSMNSQSRVPSPVPDLLPNFRPVWRKQERRSYREFEPLRYERTKVFTLPVSETIQVSKTSADAFTLPREPTQITQKHVDFSELEESRFSPGNKSPEKLSRLSRHSRDSKDSYTPKLSNTPTRLKDRLEKLEKLRDLTPVKSRLRHLDSNFSHNSDSILMDSPLFKSSKTNSLTNQSKKQGNSLDLEDERQYKHHVPKQMPRKYEKHKQADSNFALQITRTKTIVAPVLADPMENTDRIAQLKRYAAMHNPQAMSTRGNTEKLRPMKARHVSIPTGRADSPVEEAGKLCIGNRSPLQGSNKPSFSSGSGWKDRNDLDRLQNKKGVHAGIVKMYIKNNEVVGAVEKPLYTSISDGSGHIEDFSVKDPFVVQSLLKNPMTLSEDDINTGFPDIGISATKGSKRRDKRKVDGTVSLPVTSRVEAAVDSRVS